MKGLFAKVYRTPQLRRSPSFRLFRNKIAARLDDLRVPPGNRLEALRGDRIGQHSIRVNEQFRICFHWTAGGPENVEITDYH